MVLLAPLNPFPFLLEKAQWIRRSCKQNKVIVLVKNALRLFVDILASAAQCWNNCIFDLRRNSADRNAMVHRGWVGVYPFFIIQERERGNLICNV